jgi:hypothetical protein
VTRTQQPRGTPKPAVCRPNRSSAPASAPPAQRRRGGEPRVDDDLRARDTAERRLQELALAITDVTVLSRLTLRVRQAASQPRLLERPSTQGRGHRDIPAAPLEIREAVPDALAIGCVLLGRVPGRPDAS